MSFGGTLGSLLALPANGLSTSGSAAPFTVYTLQTVYRSSNIGSVAVMSSVGATGTMEIWRAAGTGGPAIWNTFVVTGVPQVFNYTGGPAFFHAGDVVAVRCASGTGSGNINLTLFFAAA